MTTVCNSYAHISSEKYHSLIQKMRDFFLSKDFLEVPVQSRLSILAACEDPFTVSSFNWAGTLWPLPQTGQMWLEVELLKQPNFKGVFCLSTSYRNEPNQIAGRHEKIFPMIEFESHGNMDDLRKFEKELLNYLKMEKPYCIAYEKACSHYQVEEITYLEEAKLCEEFSNSLFLESFPGRTSPFWNMKYKGEDLFNKIDVILFGQETIGSAERATDKEEMRHFFHTISDGGYSKKLYDLFGKSRVEEELEEYLSLDFFPRFGGGIGVTRLLRALDLLKNSF